MGNENQIEKALRFIEWNLDQDLTLGQVSSESGMSKFHFTRVFKAKTGMTFKEFHNSKRIERDKALLKNGESRITEICYEVGFNDTAYFDRVFRRDEGMSPSAYRKRFKGGWEFYQGVKSEKSKIVQLFSNIVQANH